MVVGQVEQICGPLAVDGDPDDVRCNRQEAELLLESLNNRALRQGSDNLADRIRTNA